MQTTLLRACGLAGLSVLLTASALAARITTVQDLRQMLADHSAHDSDSSLAHRLLAVELAEQLTPADETELESAYKLGPKSTEALQLIAQESVFNNPPAADFAPGDAPSETAASAMLAAAARYADTALQRMPNFLAMRTTRGYDDSPITFVTADGFRPPNSDMHSISSAVEQVAYRNGKEVADTSDKPGEARGQAAQMPLDSKGDFGPVMGVLLRDLPSGTARFDHWERLPAGRAAVFNYQIPAKASHYHLYVCCVFGTAQLHSEFPAYRGKIYIDPGSGTVLRISLQAELKSSDSIRRGDMLVDYTPVKLGAATFFCPSRTIAILQALTRTEDRVIKRVNISTFSNYRRFGSEVRMVK